jgi:hypothetical protein
LIQADRSKCFQCTKKVGLLGMPEDHNCTVDYKQLGKAKLYKEIKKVVASKINHIWFLINHLLIRCLIGLFICSRSSIIGCTPSSIRPEYCSIHNWVLYTYAAYFVWNHRCTWLIQFNSRFFDLCSGSWRIPLHKFRY